MSWHHNVKPHQHIAIWVVATISVLASAISYNTITVDRILAQSEPSEQTKKFFGFDGEDGEREFVAPEICKQPAQADEMQKISEQMQTVSNELASYQQKDPATLTDTEKTKMQELQSQFTALQNKINELQQTMQTGPSDDCKIAMIQQILTRMEEMQSKMESRFFGTLTKVDNTVEKVDSSLGGLEAAGVSKEKLDQIKSDLATIKTSAASLRSFFSKMQSSMQLFIALAKAEPLKAFDEMQQGRGFASEDGANDAAKAADNMVKAFENLIGVLDEISK